MALTLRKVDFKLFETSEQRDARYNHSLFNKCVFIKTLKTE